MSRLSTLSASAIKAMFSSETDARLIMLITVYDPENPSVPVLRLADGFTQRLTANNPGDVSGQPVTSDDEVIYGVVSRGHNYVFMPMEIEMPGELETGVSNCSIAIQYVTAEAIELIRSHIFGPAKIDIELVLAGDPDEAGASNPNTVEATFPGFYVTNITYTAQAINLDLTMIDYAREPFPCYSFTPSYFPGLF